MNTSNLQPNNYYDFTHTTSSPRYIQSNREAERAVKTIKSLFKKNDDPYIALTIYHSTPLHNGFLSSENLMNRRLHTTLPILESQLQPSISEYSVMCERETMRKAKSKKFLIHVIEHVATLDPLLPGQQVWISERRDSGVIVEQLQYTKS